MIPKRIHYVWVGSPLPDRQRRNIDTWRASNPGYELVQWDESNIDFSPRRLQQAYKQRLWAKVADMARLMAVHREGGFYFDVDFHLYRPLDDLLGHQCIFGFQMEERSADWVANGMLAAVPGHWFIGRALDRVMALRPMPFGLDRPTRYGPKMITRLLVAEGLRRYDPAGVQVKDIRVCPTDAFFPWPYGQAFEERFVTPRSYGLHMWDKSWERDVPRMVRVARAVLQGARRTARALV